MDLRQFLLVAFLISRSSGKPPNIVMLLTDDMGWNDVGFHGSEVPTPNIDALAYSGIVFKRHYAQPSCTPSRAALLTGQYPMRTGLQGNPILSVYKDGLPTQFRLMPEILKTLGYQTHLVGKWHLGYPTWSHMPTRRGFDSFFGYLNGFLSSYDGVHYDPPSLGLDFRSNEEEKWRIAYAKYLPQLLSEKAQSIVRDHNQYHKDEPLFLLLSINAPHDGNVNDDAPPTRSNATDFITDHKRRVLADIMRYVDDSLGNLTTTLKTEGMLDDTLIVFLSDNGGPSHPEMIYYNGASNFPFRGSKMSTFEGGVRVPAILWKSGLNSTRKSYDNLFHMSDWLPTLNRAAGGKILENLDGVDQWEALMGNADVAPRNEILLEMYDTLHAWGYLKGNFKYIKGFNRTQTNDYITDANFSPAPLLSPDGYQVENVRASSVAKALGVDLDVNNILERRNEFTIARVCSEEDQMKAALHDCSGVGCLFDVIEDPTECFDISSEYPEVMKELTGKAISYKDVTVKRPILPPDNVPNSRNYFAPSSGTTVEISVISATVLGAQIMWHLFTAWSL